VESTKNKNQQLEFKINTIIITIIITIIKMNNDNDWKDTRLTCELLDQYTEHQQDQLIKYAEKHSLTIEESINYQTHCHCCGKTVDDGMFDEMNHQYCKEKCFEHCEDYWYECFKGQDCKVCDIWRYHVRWDSLTEYDIELSECEPVLAAIDCFKELNVYPQLYGCIEDLVEYFDTDRRWRSGLV